ncbi:MAG: hypothetical protein ABI559_10740, partial [Chloroflexota bacterium]
MHEGGMAYMRYSISDTAEYGDYTRGPKIIDEHVRGNMKQVLQNIRSGAFAREWILENQAGRPSFMALRRQGADHMLEKVGAELRSMMPWLKPGNRQATASPPTTSPAPAPAPIPSPMSTPAPMASQASPPSMQPSTPSTQAAPPTPPQRPPLSVTGFGTSMGADPQPSTQPPTTPEPAPANPQAPFERGNDSGQRPSF